MHNYNKMTKTPLQLFLNWLRTQPLKHQKRLVSQIFLFLPGYTYNNSRFGEDTHNELSNYSNTLDTPFKIYGFCLFIISVLDLFFNSFPDEIMAAAPLQKIFDVRKSWNNFKLKAFGHIQLETFVCTYVDKRI
jgi:hypothetical protein